MKWGVKYKTYVVNSPVYCAYLLRKIISNGGKAKECTLKSLEEAFTLEPNVKAVVNCSGMGFEDSKSFVIRGMYDFSLQKLVETNQRKKAKHASSKTPAI